MDAIVEAARAGGAPLFGGSAVPFHPQFDVLETLPERRTVYCVGYNDPFYYGCHLVDSVRRIVDSNWLEIEPNDAPGSNFGIIERPTLEHLGIPHVLGAVLGVPRLRRVRVSPLVAMAVVQYVVVRAVALWLAAVSAPHRQIEKDPVGLERLEFRPRAHVAPVVFPPLAAAGLWNVLSDIGLLEAVVSEVVVGSNGLFGDLTRQ